MRRKELAGGNFYHVYNRGVDGRNVFLCKKDFERFLESIAVFNTTEPVGGIYANSFVQTTRKQLRHTTSKLVNIICYCLNSNHFHLLLEQCVDGGIGEFMRRLGGYTKYFNNKYKRSGVLFQGRCKSIHIDSNEYLLYVSVYINLNNEVHRLRHTMSKSSWDEYMKMVGGICKRDVILDQFQNIKEYGEFAEETLKYILERKDLAKELKEIFLE